MKQQIVGDVERIESWSLLRPGTNVTFLRLCYSNTIAVIGSEVIQLNKKKYIVLNVPHNGRVQDVAFLVYMQIWHSPSRLLECFID